MSNESCGDRISATNESFFNGDFNSVIVDGLVDNKASQVNSENNNKSLAQSNQEHYSRESSSSCDSQPSPELDRVERFLPERTQFHSPSRNGTKADPTQVKRSYSYFLSFDEDGENLNIDSDSDTQYSPEASFSSGENTSSTNLTNYLLIQSNFGETADDRDLPLSFLNNSRNSDPSWETSLTLSDQQGTSLESSSSWTVSFLTEIEVKATHPKANSFCAIRKENANNSLKMETELQSSEKVDKEPGGEEDKAGEEEKQRIEDDAGESEEQEAPTVESPKDETKEQEGIIEEEEGEDDGEEESEYNGAEEYEEGEQACGVDEDEDEDTTTLSSEAVVDDIELILMPEMCQDMQSSNLSPKLVRVTELKLNADDVFCDDDETDEDQSSRHEFRSIVDEVCEEEEIGTGAEGPSTGRLSIGDDDVSSGSELISGSGRRIAGETSKSSSSSGRRRRSTSGRISSGVQTDITAVDEPKALSGHGFRKKSSGKSSRLGVPGGGSTNGKKLNWKSELTLLPSKMKVKQSSFNSFEGTDERDQYSPRVAKFTSQDTLNLSSQFLKPSTLYRTRNLSRNLNQFASSESTFMLPMSSEQQLSSCGIGESPRFRDRVSSSTTHAAMGGNASSIRGAATSYSAYQISSILSGSSNVVSGTSMGMGLNTPSSARLSRQTNNFFPYPQQQLSSAYSGGGAGHMFMMSSKHFRSSMPDLNAVNKSYVTVAASSFADSHRRKQPNSGSKSTRTSSSSHRRHPHHSSTSSAGGGFRLQKKSSSDEETSSLIDESERCLRSSIDLLLTDELPSPGGGLIGASTGDSTCFRSSAFGGSTAANVGGLANPGLCYYSSRRTYSQPILNDQAYPPDMKDPSMGSPFLPRKLSDMRCSRFAKVILPNGHVAVVAVKDTDEIQDSLTVHTDTGCVINLPFRKVVFAWRSSKR